MQNARILLVEDFQGTAEALKRYLPLKGHEIVFHVADLKSAIEIVDSGKLEQEKINLAIVDAHFPEAPKSVGTSLCGPDVATAIRETGLPIKIICYSTLDDDYGDVFVRKGGTDIAEAISKL